MLKRILSSRISIILAVIAFMVAALPAFGLVMKEDPIGRAIFTAVWVLVGIAWLGNLVRVRKSASKE